VKEYYYSGRDEGKQKTDSEFADDLQSFIGELPVKAVIIDPSAASFIAELRKRNIKVQKAKNDVLDGIRFMAALLTKELIKFNDCCQETFKEFSSYIWDSKASERGEDKPVKENDHALDSDRYFCYTVVRIPRATRNYSGKGAR